MSETLMTDGEVKTYRGASIEELLPQIRAELGPEAVIVRRREGLVGGFAGFFQKRCIEVEARAGGPRIDVYDDSEGGAPVTVAEPNLEEIPVLAEEPVPAPELVAAGVPTPSEPHPVRNDAATREGMATPAMRRLVGEAAPFADLLDQMTTDGAGSPAAGLPATGTPATTPEVEADDDTDTDAIPEPKRIANLRESMVAAGLGADLAGDVVDSVVANVSPFFSPGRLKTLVRNELSLRLPVAPAPGPGRRRLAVVGPAGTGKTAAVARIASAHAAAGQQVACFTVEPVDGGAALRALLGDSGVKVEAISCDELAVALLGENAAFVLIDTPSASSGAATSIETMAATLTAAGLDEIHLAVRAGTASPAAVEMLERLRPLGPNRILVTAAADTSYIGAAVDVAIRTAMPIHYVAENVVDLAPADPRVLASKVMP